MIACYESERARGDQLQAEKASLQSDLRKAAAPIERRPSVPQLLAPPDASAMEGSVKGTCPAPWSWQLVSFSGCFKGSRNFACGNSPPNPEAQNPMQPGADKAH